MDLAELEVQGKLQVKVGRTLLRDKLIMVGNALLLSFLFVAVMLLIWSVAWQTLSPALLRGYGAGLLGVDEQTYNKLVALLIGLFKIEGVLLFLCPGLACRICGQAMKP